MGHLPGVVCPIGGETVGTRPQLAARGGPSPAAGPRTALSLGYSATFDEALILTARSRLTAVTASSLSAACPPLVGQTFGCFPLRLDLAVEHSHSLLVLFGDGMVLASAEPLGADLVIADIETTPLERRPPWHASRNLAVTHEYVRLLTEGGL
jgi:hypothetical protein